MPSYVVEKLLAMRWVGDTQMFRVKWKARCRQMACLILLFTLKALVTCHELSCF